MFGLDRTKRGPNGVVRCGESLGGVHADGLEALSVGVDAVELDACLDRSKKRNDSKQRSNMFSNLNVKLQGLYG